MNAKLILSETELSAAREWLSDLSFGDSDDLDFATMEPMLIQRGVARFYDGGLSAFQSDCVPVLLY